MLKTIQNIHSLRYTFSYFFSAQPLFQNNTHIKYKQLTPKDFSRLDIRIGQILQSDLHTQVIPHYCKKIRVQKIPNTIINVASGPINNIEQQKFIGRVAVIVNIHPGYQVVCKNEGNILYAQDDNKTKVQMIVPDGQIGDRIFLQDLQQLFPSQSFLPTISSSDLYFLQILKDLKPDKNGYIEWKGRKLMTKNSFLKTNLKNLLVL